MRCTDRRRFSARANQELMNDTSTPPARRAAVRVSGETWEVTRTLRRSGQHDVGQVRAVLRRVGDDGATVEQVEQVRRVNERIEELLGLDSDAFLRTVVSAPGPPLRRVCWWRTGRATGAGSCGRCGVPTSWRRRESWPEWRAGRPRRCGFNWSRPRRSTRRTCIPPESSSRGPWTPPAGGRRRAAEHEQAASTAPPGPDRGATGGASGIRG